MVDKSAFVLSMLVTVPEAITAVVEEAGIPVLVEIVEAADKHSLPLSQDSFMPFFIFYFLPFMHCYCVVRCRFCKKKKKKKKP